MGRPSGDGGRGVESDEYGGGSVTERTAAVVVHGDDERVGERGVREESERRAVASGGAAGAGLGRGACGGGTGSGSSPIQASGEGESGGRGGSGGDGDRLGFGVGG
nr:glycine-rich protein DOT1-like [Aegilops tauschii subsp. strangulata]